MNRRSNTENFWGTSKVRNTVGGRRAAIRVLMDNFTGMVVAYEQEATGPDGPRRLVFESAAVIIKVDNYPEHWRRMGDEALLALRYPNS